MSSVSGRIYYIMIPSTSIQRSATFYSEVFGWNIRERGDGATSFDDTSGNVSGTFTTEHRAVNDPGFTIFIGSDDIEADCAKVKATGGTIEQEPDLSVADVTAFFRDPDGNRLGLHQYIPENAN